jgi:hypothetical protein
VTGVAAASGQRSSGLVDRQRTSRQVALAQLDGQVAQGGELTFSLDALDNEPAGGISGTAASAISARSDLKSAIVPLRLSRPDEESLTTKPGQL